MDEPALLHSVANFPPLAPPAYSRVTQLLSTAPTATRGDEDAVQNNHAFDNGEKGREAIHAGQSLSSLFVGSAAEAVAAGKAIWWEGDKQPSCPGGRRCRAPASYHRRRSSRDNRFNSPAISTARRRKTISFLRLRPSRMQDPPDIAHECPRRSRSA